MYLPRSISTVHAFRYKRSDTIQSWTLKRAPFRLLPSSTYTYRLHTVDRMSGLDTKFSTDWTIWHVPSYWPVLMGHFPFLHEAMHRTGLPCSASKSPPSNRGTEAASHLLGMLHPRSLQLRDLGSPIRHCGRRHFLRTPDSRRRRSTQSSKHQFLVRSI